MKSLAVLSITVTEAPVRFCLYMAGGRRQISDAPAPPIESKTDQTDAVELLRICRHRASVGDGSVGRG